MTRTTRLALKRAALESYISITKMWHLDEYEQATLMGISLQELRMGSISQVQIDSLERISHIIAIHKALCVLINVERIGQWMRASNAQFAGTSALNIMLNDGMTGITC